MTQATEYVTIPFEHFLELQAMAEVPSPPRPIGQRIFTTVQTVIVCAALSGAFTAGAWGAAKATVWAKQKELELRNRNTRVPRQTRPTE